MLTGCGSSNTNASNSTTTSSAPSTAARITAASSTPAPGLAAAERPSAALFPTGAGKTLHQIANLATAQTQLGAATATFTPGNRRLAFGITSSNEAFVYAPTAVYIARSPDEPARGPFVAPADPMTVAAQYRSNENEGPGGLQAIYSANVPVPRAGKYTILALTRAPQGLLGASGQIVVAPSSPIPDVGQRPPAIATDTLASVHGNISLLTTRNPPENMQSASLKDLLGTRPVALLFSTPQLCQSRICGPVTDIAVEMQHEFGNRVTFIHEEVYVNNQPDRGLRPQLKAFHLQTEPWLFTINRDGAIAARLEGAFGTTEFRQALEASLR
jgi:hypothetical protein